MTLISLMFCILYQVYCNSSTSHRLTGLSSAAEYQVRVCAVRVCTDGSPDLTGAYSPGVTFQTASPKPVITNTPTSVVSARLSERKPLTDQQWAMLFLLGFTVVAIFMAFLAQNLIAYTSSSSNTAK